MIDRFKLRVWENTEKKYHYFDLSIPSSLNDLAFWTNEDMWCEMYETDTKEFCIGLKDKNDVLIYEGDLVNLDGYGVCQVIWSDGTADFMFKNLNEDLCEYIETMLLCDWEVIGNIHESGGK